MTKKLTAEQIRAFITVAEFMEERGVHKLELYANEAFNRFDSAVMVRRSRMPSARFVTLAGAVEAAFDFDEAPGAEDDNTFRVGDVFAKGDARWRVEIVTHDGRAVLRSERASWATTRPLTWAEEAAEGFVRVERGPEEA